MIQLTEKEAMKIVMILTDGITGGIGRMLSDGEMVSKLKKAGYIKKSAIEELLDLFEPIERIHISFDPEEGIGWKASYGKEALRERIKAARKEYEELIK